MKFQSFQVLSGALLCSTSLLLSSVEGACPFANLPGARESRYYPHGENDYSVSSGTRGGSPGRMLWGGTGESPYLQEHRRLLPGDGEWGEPEEGYEAVMADIKTLLTDSQDFWPADFGNYGPLFIRLAWHSAGSYRTSDGRGGGEGGAMRFDPTKSWDDNANLDKAIDLLMPIKHKYGSQLSWGDLMILAGDASIEAMGGPILGFCGGRVDFLDGEPTIKLGPSPEQEEILPCAENDGNCTTIGATTLELIYVNPTGHLGVPDPVGSVPDLRSTFGRMGMNDTETVALTGGGHGFGKCHGACAEPPCGQGTPQEGIGPNTFTSGLEGEWTTQPTVWDNEYFNNLLNYEYNLTQSPAGKPQWEPTNGPPIIMLTADLAFLEDDKYKAIVDTFASDTTELENQFKHAWYKLMTRDMGPIERCLGNLVPPVQDFQRPLPPAPEQLPDYIPIRSAIQTMIDEDNTIIPELINLAYRCSFTYRETDHAGGCNGARIRFSPEKDWPENMGTQETLSKLEPIKTAYPDISYSDLIVLAGQTALEEAGGIQMPFCGGRTDASDAKMSDVLAPRHYEPAVVSIRDDMEVKGLTAKQMVALAGRPMMVSDGGANSAATVTNDFFKQLVDLDFEATLQQDEKSEGTGQAISSDDKAFVSVGTDVPLYLTAEEYALVQDPEFYKVVQLYATDEASFKSQLASAWTYMMTAGRYSGPTSNICTGRDDPTMNVDQLMAMGSAEAVTKDTTSATANADQSSAAKMVSLVGVTQFFVGATIILVFSLL